MKRILLLAAVTLFGASMAQAAAPVHTWHTVSATNGSWQARLVMMNENGKFYNRAGSPIWDFNVNSSTPYDYGFGFERGSDFDIAYTLTVIEKTKPSFVSKACVYVITASGPGKPDIRTSSFNGAKCDYKIVSGVGEDFIVG